VIVAWLLGCGTPDATPAIPVLRGSTQLHRYEVALELPNPPPLGELFDVKAKLTLPDGTPIENAKVTMDARMPEHAHGMQTDPKADPGVCEAANLCTHPNGEYTSHGFKFHMSGLWSISVQVEGPRGVDSTSFELHVEE
jgi:hypothetical protein